MNCPADATPLSTIDRNGVLVRWCPRCRGVWLSRFDVERLVGSTDPAAAPTPPGRPADTRLARPGATQPYERYRNGRMRTPGQQATNTLREVLDI